MSTIPAPKHASPVFAEQVPQVCKAVERFSQVKETLEAISELNQQLLRMDRDESRQEEREIQMRSVAIFRFANLVKGLSVRGADSLGDGNRFNLKTAVGTPADELSPSAASV